MSKCPVTEPSPPSEGGLFYLSFVDAGRPTGSKWIGAIITRAATAEAALAKANVLGINPGGEVIVIEFEDWAIPKIPVTVRDRLLGFADVRAIGLGTTKGAPSDVIALGVSECCNGGRHGHA